MVMRYAGSFILLLLAFTVLAKSHDTCRVYQYYGNDSLNKALVLTQAFNKKGKIVYERANHYIIYQTVEGTTINNVKPDGEYFYTYENNKLVETIERFWGTEATEVDSILHKYDYDGMGNLTRQIVRWHEVPSPIREDNVDEYEMDTNAVKVWRTPDTTAYFYDPKNDSLVERQEYYKGKVKSTKHYRTFDSLGRISVDSIDDNTEYKYNAFVTYYEYALDSFSQLTCSDYSRHCILFGYKLSKTGRVIREYDYSYDDADERYKQHSKTETVYDNKNRIVKSIYFAGKQKTTTHEFVYK